MISKLYYNSTGTVPMIIIIFDFKVEKVVQRVGTEDIEVARIV